MYRIWKEKDVKRRKGNEMEMGRSKKGKLEKNTKGLRNKKMGISRN